MPKNTISTTRQIVTSWGTYVMVNENDRRRSYQMSIPAKPQADGTTLDWVIRYSNQTREQELCALSIMDSYQYLLSANITTEEAINRLRMLRREYQSQPDPKPVH